MPLASLSSSLRRVIHWSSDWAKCYFYVLVFCYLVEHLIWVVRFIWSEQGWPAARSEILEKGETICSESMGNDLHSTQNCHLPKCIQCYDTSYTPKHKSYKCWLDSLKNVASILCSSLACNISIKTFFNLEDMYSVHIFTFVHFFSVH